MLDEQPPEPIGAWSSPSAVWRDLHQRARLARFTVTLYLYVESSSTAPARCSVISKIMSLDSSPC